ncbi:MAG: hypothetical protein AAF388_25040, partial [Bacteroidota bacterium]
MKGIQEIRWYGGSLILLLFLLSACTQYDEASIAEDEMLAKARCGSCHLYPEPSLLPKEKWDTVLIRMGARMGVPSRYYDPYEKKSMQKVFKLKAANVYPEQPTISEEEWKRINRFFKKVAPKEVIVDRVKDWGTTTQFQPKYPDTGFPGESSITMVEFDADAKALYVADRNGNFIKLGQDLSTEYKTRFLKPIVDIARIDEESLYALTIGQLYPDEGTSGA